MLKTVNKKTVNNKCRLNPSNELAWKPPAILEIISNKIYSPIKMSTIFISFFKASSVFISLRNNILYSHNKSQRTNDIEDNAIEKLRAES
jgi:hypothetical protein